MEDNVSCNGVWIKEEVIEGSPAVVIKPEPGSPVTCTEYTTPAPLPAPSQPTLPPRPLGKFSSTRSDKTDKPIDLSTYNFGLYSYYAEGNTNNEFNEPHFDPYYGQADLKDPALLVRAKRYFESLRQEMCNEGAIEQFEMRSESSGNTREHRPMYQRKRKKVQRLVILVPKIPISSSVKDYLRAHYPPESNRAVRLAARKRCRSGQEVKLQEFLHQFQAGSSQTVAKPYSLSYCQSTASSSGTSSPLPRCITPLSQQYTPPNSVPDTPPNSVPGPQQYTPPNSVPGPLYSDPTPINYSVHQTVSDQPTLGIKDEPIEYTPSIVPCTIKQEMTDCPHHQASIKSSTLDFHDYESPLPSVNSENIAPNVQPHSFVESQLERQRKKKKKKKKKVCIPFQIKEEPLDEDGVELMDTAESDEESGVPAPKSPAVSTLPASELGTLPASELGEVVSTEPVKVKEEQLDPDQMLMVEIFKKRVKKLRKLTVLPMLAVKEEPLDYEDFQFSNPPPPEIKEEPMEATLLFFKPKPKLQNKTPQNKPLKYVYGRRVQGRARMSTSNPLGRAAREEAEFDNAAKLDATFSPPKSAWSKIIPDPNSPPQSGEESEETRALNTQIAKLIEAGNIRSLDDTERMYNLFAATITELADPQANVFNIVLEKFRESKEPVKADEPKPKTIETAPESPKSKKQVVLFPMSDQEIYNQGVEVVEESRPPGEFEFPSVKVEPEEVDQVVCRPSVGSPIEHQQPNVDSEESSVSGKDLNIRAENEDSTPPDDLKPTENQQTPTIEPSSLFEQVNPIRIKNMHHDRVSIYRTYIPEVLSELQPSSRTSYPLYQPSPIGGSIKVRKFSEEKIRVVDEVPNDTTTTPESTEKQSRLVKGAGDQTEAERLFDEMLAEDPQPPYQTQEPTYLEPFTRHDTLFASTSLDDFIKVPVNANEHLIKPKPSYARMNYLDSESTGEGFKPGPTVLFSSRPEDMVPKDIAEWAQWKRHHESFDQFQNTSWTMDDQSQSWSPQHSIYDSYLEPQNSSSSFEDHQKQNTPEQTGQYQPWQDHRRNSLVSNPLLPIVERSQSGREVIRIPVEQRTAQTQFPERHRNCASVEVSVPVYTLITQRQEDVSDRSTQTESLTPYDSGCLSSVLVEPLLSARKVSRPNVRAPTTPPVTSQPVLIPPNTVEQRTIQTQYPSNSAIYTAFEPSPPFHGSMTCNKLPSDCSSQTDGAPLFPPWVAPGRFRRHRPVLVEPLPNIEPIGDNVRTMRSSDAYSILMEQIRTCNDPSFDKFMNSQRQPNGIASTLNKYACYAPQGNSPELPLTVKKDYPKKTGNGCKGKRPGIEYKEVSPQQIPSEHSNKGLTPYQISVKIRRMGQVENIIGRLSHPKKRKSLSPKR